jgi:hypothetical protein
MRLLWPTSRSDRTHLGTWDQRIKRSRSRPRRKIRTRPDRRHQKQSGRKIPKEAFLHPLLAPERIDDGGGQSRMLPSVSYTQTGALTRISSKLIIATAPSSLPLAQHNHMALVYTTTSSSRLERSSHRLLPEGSVVNAFRNDKTLTGSG